jgi:hypothetical protein
MLCHGAFSGACCIMSHVVFSYSVYPRILVSVLCCYHVSWCIFLFSLSKDLGVCPMLLSCLMVYFLIQSIQRSWCLSYVVIMSHGVFSYSVYPRILVSVLCCYHVSWCIFLFSLSKDLGACPMLYHVSWCIFLFSLSKDLGVCPMLYHVSWCIFLFSLSKDLGACPMVYNAPWCIFLFSLSKDLGVCPMLLSCLMVYFLIQSIQRSWCLSYVVIMSHGVFSYSVYAKILVSVLCCYHVSWCIFLFSLSKDLGACPMLLSCLMVYFLIQSI